MTAMSAPRALGTSSAPTAPSRTSATPGAGHVRVRIAGSPRTFEVREVLRGMGLRWDPLSHAWHGSVPPAGRIQIVRDLGLPVQVVRPLDEFPTAPEPPARPAQRGGDQIGLRRVRDGARTRVEARVAFPDHDEPDESLAGSRFSAWDVTSGLPDDSREADERAAERQLRDLRGRVKVARTVVAREPRLKELLTRDDPNGARFCAQFGITSELLRSGAPGPIEDQSGPY